jgi:hypothetical protein
MKMSTYQNHQHQSAIAEQDIKTPNSSNLCHGGDSQHDPISENTLENLPLQDATEIYKPNSKSCTTGKLTLCPYHENGLVVHYIDRTAQSPMATQLPICLCHLSSEQDTSRLYIIMIWAPHLKPGCRGSMKGLPNLCFLVDHMGIQARVTSILWNSNTEIGKILVREVSE